MTESLPAKPFSTLLVANRGEIARRVIRSARAAGLRTVAVYSDADREAAHVNEADTAVHLGPTRPAQSYLDIDRLLAACRDSGAEAVHPGYGFLSERAGFARAVVDAGLVWVGPPAQVIDLMGRKDRARAVASDAGVPVIPSYPLDADPADMTFPVLVKAAAGGGGKGMRVVRTRGDLPDAMAAARRESAAAFGDDSLLLERFVEKGRHVEVQVLADTHGTVLHLFERDCSTQRRHQKVLEESPAPTVSAALRERLTSAAVALARQVGYVNAGTVEFLVAGEEFFLLEMNTRLQVEHPVTELVTGLDLVALQLRVAAGEPLPIGQDGIHLDGHAMEARVYAEDPYAGFLPQAGRADRVEWPRGVRVDEALESGQVVSSAYDPMLGKVVAHGSTREEARHALVSALEATVIAPLRTNVGFLRDLVDSATFAEAAVHTSWLDDDPGAEALITAPAADGEVWAAAAAVLAHPPGRHVAGSPFGQPDGWRSAGPPAPVRYPLLLGDELRFVKARDSVDTTVVSDQETVTVTRRGHRWTFERPDPFGAHASHAVTGGNEVEAPMPGTVRTVDVEVGQPVEAGQTLGVLEAMKMELALTAPFAGTVAGVAVTPGDAVALGQVLFRVEEPVDA